MTDVLLYLYGLGALLWVLSLPVMAIAFVVYAPIRWWLDRRRTPAPDLTDDHDSDHTDDHKWQACELPLRPTERRLR